MVSVLDRIRAIAAEQFGLDEDEVSAESDFAADFEADPDDIDSLAQKVEEEFAIEVPDRDVGRFFTVDDVVKYVESHIQVSTRDVVQRHVEWISQLSGLRLEVEWSSNGKLGRVVRRIPVKGYVKKLLFFNVLQSMPGQTIATNLSPMMQAPELDEWLTTFHAGFEAGYKSPKRIPGRDAAIGGMKSRQELRAAFGLPPDSSWRK